jgi:peptidoglycan pentaglycine glycine transferase (the first glycine)
MSTELIVDGAALPRVALDLAVEVDRAPTHPEWDAWVARTPGGHHLQTAGWAHVKAGAGWSAIRVLLRSAGEPVAGCQLLVKKLPVVGSVAYVPRGPLLSTNEPALLDALLGALRRVARTERIVLLKVQPPVDRDDMPAQLAQRGLKASDLHTAPAASVSVDLAAHADEDSLFKALRSTTRRRVRQAQKKGIVVRRGGAEDLPLLQSLLEATAARQGFDPYPGHYYRRLWESFAPAGQAWLQLAEHEGTALSASLLIAYGDTVLYKIGAWGGEKGSPPGANELMHWTGMTRARAEGFAYYDFEGIPIDVARAVQGGAEASSDMGVAFFKLGFGGDVVIYPGTYDLAFGRVVGPAFGHASRDQRLRKVVHRVSGRG